MRRGLGQSILALFLLNIDRVLGFDVIAHDAVATIIDHNAHPVVLGFQPVFFSAGDDCDPFPAVDVHGRVGGGLLPSGPGRKDCSRETVNIEQIYSRAGYSHHRWGIMYAWYMPKLEMQKNNVRHAWISIVVWIYNHGNHPLDPGQISGPYQISYYYNGSYWRLPVDKNHWNHGSSHPNIGILEDIAQPWQYGGDLELQPLVDWDSMPQLAKDTLNTFDFGDHDVQRVPFNDHNFAEFMSRAYTGKEQREGW